MLDFGSFTSSAAGSHCPTPAFGTIGRAKPNPDTAADGSQAFAPCYNNFDMFSCCSSEPGHSPSTTIRHASPAPSLYASRGPNTPLPSVAPPVAVVGDSLGHSDTFDAPSGEDISVPSLPVATMNPDAAFHEAVFTVVHVMVQQGARAGQKPVTDPHAAPFYKRAVMGILKSPLCSGEAIIIGLVLIARLQRTTPIAVSSTTIRRVFAACAMIAAKLHDDAKCYVECFAHAANCPTHLLVATERQVLQRLNYATWVEEADYTAMAETVGRATVPFLRAPLLDEEPHSQ